MLERVAHHVGQKQAVAPGLLHDVLSQTFQQGRLTVYRAQVEKHTGQHQCFGLGAVYSVVKVVHPDAMGLSPCVSHRHHLSGAVGVAAGGKAITDPLGERLKIGAVKFSIVGIVQDQALVLV